MLLNLSPFKNVGDIETWLQDFQIWQCVTNLDEKQQGPVICLLLPDKVRNSLVWLIQIKMMDHCF